MKLCETCGQALGGHNQTIHPRPCTAKDRLDNLTRACSAFPDFETLVSGTFPDYRPTLYITDQAHLLLALAYDAAQRARKDPRRAHTGGTAPQVGDALSFYAGNTWRQGTIEKVGPARVRTSYVTRVARRRAKRYGVEPVRSTRYIRLASLSPCSPPFAVGRAWTTRWATEMVAR